MPLPNPEAEEQCQRLIRSASQESLLRKVPPSSFTPPFAPSVIVFSNMNEDYRVELATVRELRKRSGEGISGSFRVATVASSSETSMALASQSDIKIIDAVDLNEWQINLCELRRAALLHLDRDEQLRLLGLNQDFERHEDCDARLYLYDKIRDHLPEDVREAWDDRREFEIQFGIGHCGQSDIINHDLQACLDEHGMMPVGHHDALSFLEDDTFLECWRRTYSFANFRRRSETLHIDQHGMDEMAARHLAVLHRPGIGLVKDNHFFSYYYTNYFGEAEAGLPLCFQLQAQRQALSLGCGPSRLRYHRGDIVEVTTKLAQSAGLYDMISASNIVDWITEKIAIRLLDNLAENLRPGGALLLRHETHSLTYLEDLAAQTSWLETDPSLNKQLLHADRALLTRDIAILWKRESKRPA